MSNKKQSYLFKNQPNDFRTPVSSSGSPETVITSSQHQKQEDIDSRTGGSMEPVFTSPRDPLFYGRTNLTASAYDSTPGGDGADRGSTHAPAASTVGGGNTSKATATAASKDPTNASVGQTEKDS